jgi:PAS domain S-box-containing protein
MVSRVSLDVELTPGLDRLVQDKIASGQYRDAGEVIHSALRRFLFEGTAESRQGPARTSLDDGERQIAPLFRQAAAGMAQVDREGRFIQINDHYCSIVGRGREELLTLSMLDITHADDLPLNEAAFARLLEEGEGFELEKRYVRPDGSIVWVRNAVTPIRTGSGEIETALGVCIDITGRKRAEKHQLLLINELNHRVKNTLSTVQSLAAQTFKNSDRCVESYRVFEDRLLALSRAHDILTRENWEGAELQALLAEVLEPHLREGPERILIDGPFLRLGPRFALALAMAVHELATNAVKYGALRVPAGHVLVTWTIAPSSPARLVFHWQERGGPAVEPPAHRGFGSRLIERSLARELAGEVRLVYEPEGLVCIVSAPLTEKPFTAAAEDLM